VDTSTDFTETAGIGRLRWRCRRGLLENDLLLARFFQHHETQLTMPSAQPLTAALMHLMDLADNDLLDLFLGRQQPTGELDQPAVWHVLSLIRGVPLLS
jgi:antitoxin CptB